MWPPEKATVVLPWGEATVLYELLKRYHESERAEIVTDQAEWRVLVNVCGQLERGGTIELPEYQRVLAEAREELAGGAPEFRGAPELS
jgi:hypothetical protein